MVVRTLLLQLAGSHWLEVYARNNRLSRRLARRFVAGDSLEEATEPIRQLNAQKIAVSLDFLGESVADAGEVEAAECVALQMLQHIRREQLDANISVKLTALGLDFDEQLCRATLGRILTAAGSDGFVRIDMEDSSHTQRTLDTCMAMWNGTPAQHNVGVVIQAYLYRSEEDVKALLKAGVRVRLCKGAYKEQATVAFRHKHEVDANYLRLAGMLLDSGLYHGFATHDPAMIAGVQRYAAEHSIKPEAYEFQMLYGIRRDLQTALVAEGYRMRVYVPFGTHWYPYFMRRMAERPANLWFVLRNMAR
ncbi:MAG: proline dehydrogenase family protein [Armatimonadetes bacterium]|nr:proline dehydrogenase family protein [Armatimonadota bacterium]MDE2205418.1 proline dehydrogenase family protein [Armatimonadota bacterium]